MPADSTVRRVAKRLLAPVLNEKLYAHVQSLSMTWDIATGGFSEPELALVRLAVREGDTVIDIGANYGLYTYHLSKAVGVRGRVYAFEPVPSTCATLRLIVSYLRLRNVEISQTGCSTASSRVVFTLPLQTSGAPVAGLAHIRTPAEGAAGTVASPSAGRARQIECEVVSLDEALPSVTNLSFIKCDIEGAELLAFRGAEALINRHLPSVLCEINPSFLDRFEIRLDEIVGFFTDKGYLILVYDESTGRLRTTADISHLDSGNYFFVHERNAETMLSNNH